MSVGYDYVVSSLIAHELLFSMPNNFNVSEIDLDEKLSKTSEAYRVEFSKRLTVVG